MMKKISKKAVMSAVILVMTLTAGAAKELRFEMKNVETPDKDSF
jgi:hypothetical protein